MAQVSRQDFRQAGGKCRRGLVDLGLRIVGEPLQLFVHGRGDLIPAVADIHVPKPGVSVEVSPPFAVEEVTTLSPVQHHQVLFLEQSVLEQRMPDVVAVALPYRSSVDLLLGHFQNLRRSIDWVGRRTGANSSEGRLPQAAAAVVRSVS